MDRGEPAAGAGARGAPERSGTLLAGRVGRAHGLDGSFYVTRARTPLLDVGAEVGVGGRILAIRRRAGTAQRPILALEGVEDRAAAEALRGESLTVAAEQAPSLGEGEWWAHELEGCRVMDGEELLGTVRRLVELPSCEALEIEHDRGGGPLLVPMVKEAIRRVEPERGLIEVDGGFLSGADVPSSERPGQEDRGA